MKTFIQIQVSPQEKWSDVKVLEHGFYDKKAATTWAIQTAVIMKATIRLCFPESDTDTPFNMSGIYF